MSLLLSSRTGRRVFKKVRTGLSESSLPAPTLLTIATIAAGEPMLRSAYSPPLAGSDGRPPREAEQTCPRVARRIRCRAKDQPRTAVIDAATFGSASTELPNRARARKTCRTGDSALQFRDTHARLRQGSVRGAQDALDHSVEDWIDRAARRIGVVIGNDLTGPL